MSQKSSSEDIQHEYTQKENSVSKDVLPQAAVDDYPDGGLRAWLIVFGVGFAFAECSHLK
jgi:hypothetical protein